MTVVEYEKWVIYWRLGGGQVNRPKSKTSWASKPKALRYEIYKWANFGNRGWYDSRRV